MPKKKGKKTTRRRKSAFKLLNAAENLIMANATTKGLFGTDLPHFLFDGWLPIAGFQNPTGGAGGTYTTGNSWRFSAKELIQGTLGMGGGFGISGSYGSGNNWQGLLDGVGQNFRDFGAGSVTTLIVTPLLFKAFKRVARKPINMTNRGLKALGVSRDVKV